MRDVAAAAEHGEGRRMRPPFILAPGLLERSFAYFRDCGQGRRECQVFWIGSWRSPEAIQHVVHPKHAARGDGFVIDDVWLSRFWLELAESKSGIRVQVHTHPRRAFHSVTDDRFPIIHKPGFLSLVLPDFGLGPVGFDGAYLTEIQNDGRWKQVSIDSRLVQT